jgi:hypothetical protein
MKQAYGDTLYRFGMPIVFEVVQLFSLLLEQNDSLGLSACAKFITSV